ncbi:IS5 family transposase [Undibacterium arcticum]
MARMMLRDDQWERIEGFLQGKVGDPGRHGADNRLFVEAVLWIARTGGPWRDLPGEFGPWNSVYVRFARWSDKDVWQNVFFAVLREDADFEEVFLDSTIVRAHQHAAGAAKKGEQALGRSKGGLSTKIHACVEGLGQLARFILTGGQVNDITQAQALIVEIDAAAFLADKAYDADALLACIASKKMPRPLSRRERIEKNSEKFDRHQYRNRNLIERFFFAQLKQFRRVATRYDKLASRFGSFVALVASLLWLK